MTPPLQPSLPTSGREVELSALLASCQLLEAAQWAMRSLLVGSVPEIQPRLQRAAYTDSSLGCAVQSSGSRAVRTLLGSFPLQVCLHLRSSHSLLFFAFAFIVFISLTYFSSFIRV